MAKKTITNPMRKEKACISSSSKKPLIDKYPEMLWDANLAVFDTALDARAQHFRCLIHSSIQLAHIVWAHSEKKPKQRALIQRCSGAILALLKK